jgi:hypothetical protein
MLGRARWLLLVVVIASAVLWASRRRPLRLAPVDLARPSAPPSVEPDAAPPPTFARLPGAPECARLRAETMTIARRLLGASGMEPPEPVGACFETVDGAWIATLDRVEEPVGSTFDWRQSMRWRLEHVGVDGSRVSAVPSLDCHADERPNLYFGNHYGTVPPVLALVDVDGDGIEEVWVTSGENGEEDHSRAGARACVYGLRGGAVVPWAGTTQFQTSELRDVDGDGRMDLIVNGPYETVDSRELPVRVVGPDLVAHQRPDGSFALDDEVAVRFARDACPHRPTSFLDPSTALLDESQIVCGRLWGMTESEVRGIVADDCGQRRDVWCHDQAYDGWITAKPPLRIQ